MIAISGVLAVVAFVFVLIGAFDGTGFVYASIVVSLVAAAVLPLGVERYVQRHRRHPSPSHPS
jgi:drug/metabolite transporter (DMT)-like permease